MDSTFWHGKRILLTGHTGFKGSWLALWLHRLGAQVTGFAQPPLTQPSLFELVVSQIPVRSIIADIRDADAVESAVQDTDPHIIFHLAAQALVRPSYKLPVETFATNVMGTVSLLDSARRARNLQAVVVVTSDKCYENREWVWPYRECDPMGGHDPYSASKGCAELATASMQRAFFDQDDAPGIATARAGNVIGGGDWSEDRLVPDIVNAFLRQESPLIRNPEAVRPWQHVLEPLAGYLVLARQLCMDPRGTAGAWNFGPDPGKPFTVARIADALATRWPGAPDWTAGTQPQPHEATLLAVDSSKARSRLGWRPRLSIAETLDLTASWYAGHARGDDPLTLTTEQIETYERALGDDLPC